MLELLDRWTPLAQFLGPLIAGVAAVFAARSAGASRLAADATKQANEQAESERAHKFRPVMDVELVAQGNTFTWHAAVVNRHPENVAHRVVVEVSPSKDIPYATDTEPPAVPYEAVVDLPVLGHNDRSSRFRVYDQSSKPEDQLTAAPDVQFVTPLVRGRVTYSDELGLARWSQRFRVVEYATHKADRSAGKPKNGRTSRQYTVERWSAPVQVPPIEYAEGDED